MIIYHRAAISFRKTACFPYKRQNGKSAFVPLYCLMVASGFSFFKNRGLWVYLAPQRNRTTRIQRKQESALKAQVKKAPNYRLFGWLVLGNVKFLVFLGIGNVKFDVFLGLGNVKLDVFLGLGNVKLDVFLGLGNVKNY